MTLILKSNVSASNYITTALGMTVPSDFFAELDFSSEKYAIDGVSKALSQVVSTTRMSIGGYRDKDQVYKTAAQNIPRIHHDRFSGVGLITESAVINLVSSPSSPENQSVNATFSISNYFIFQVFGEGSASISIDGVNATVTENTPFCHRPGAIKTVAANIVISGSLNHMQAFMSNNPAPMQTKIAATQAADIHYFNVSTLRKGTVVLRRTEIELLSSQLSGGRAFSILQLLGATSGAIDLSTVKGVSVGKKELRYSKTGFTAGVTVLPVSGSSVDEVFAITFDLDSGQVKVLSNGSIYTNNIGNDIAPLDGIDRIILASSVSTATSALEQITKQVYAYRRVLSDAELINLWKTGK